MKLLSLVLTAIISISLITVSCGTPATATPTGTINAWLNAMESQNAQVIVSYETELFMDRTTRAERIETYETQFEGELSFSATNRNFTVESETATTTTVNANFIWTEMGDFIQVWVIVLKKVDDKWLVHICLDNQGGYLQKGQRMAVQTAVISMMIENELDTIPNPFSVLGGVATNDMAAFPDVTSACTTADKLEDADGTAYTANDKDGYLLWRHDKTADDSSTIGLVNYMPLENTIWYYTCEADGTVRQWSDAAMTTEYID
ncbi:hypothetical protein ACFLVP_02215 [Chloroflexota bacterium]